jgi:two-component system, NtrC family, sensor kinase
MAPQASTADANQDLARRVAELERELTKAHRREAAAAEVLRIIGSSPTDLQPVFDAIVASCQQLLAAHSAIVSRLVGPDLMLAAFTRVNPQADEELRRLFPTRCGPIAAAVRERTPFVIDDTETDDRLPQNERLLARRRGYRSLLVVPMLSKGHAVGTINVTRSASGGFSEQEIRLLQTFADQAVIAIENTRLFEDVQARTNELQEALEQQTATSSVLQVISRSQTDIEPVLNVVVESAMRLCDAYDAVILLKDGERCG